jgi:hypothetical protein
MAAHVRAPAPAPAPVLRIRLAAACAEAKPLHYLGTRPPCLGPADRVTIKQGALMHPNYIRSSGTRFWVWKTRELLLYKRADVTAREWLFRRSVCDRLGQWLPA